VEYCRNTESFHVDLRAIQFRKVVDKCLPIQPGAHNMVVAVIGELGTSEGNGGVDDWRVGYRDARDDAGEIGKYEHHWASLVCDRQEEVLINLG
jgi:hypothetical protein